MRPPRALWVSFDLGRPFGAPNDVGLQSRVLRAALALLDRADGPVILDDYPEDAPRATAEDMEGLVCPVRLPRPDLSTGTRPNAVVVAEMAALAPWFELGVSRRGRTTVGVSGMEIDKVVEFLAALSSGDVVQPVSGMSVAQTLRFASEDLRTWYVEAASARPGGAASSAAMADWFWGETAAGALLLSLAPRLAHSPDPELRRLVERAFIPRIHQHRIPKI